MTFRNLQDSASGWIALACAAAVFFLSVADLPVDAVQVEPARAAVATR